MVDEVRRAGGARPGEAPDPVPDEGQALIEVEFANITFVETQMRSGNGPAPVKLEPPVIPGNGVGGVVAAVGKGVDDRLVGRRVVSSTGGTGAYAEKAAVDAKGLFDVPDGLALDDAVALLADGRTATMMLSAAGPRPGERVLVEAAAGGVGTLLVQLAKNRDATVVAAAGERTRPRSRCAWVRTRRSTTGNPAGARRSDEWTSSSTGSGAT